MRNDDDHDDDDNNNNNIKQSFLAFSHSAHTSIYRRSVSQYNLTMVRKGKFHLRLVPADANNPFLEHTRSDGKVFAEVEPNVEYWVQVKSDDPRKVIATFEIDGKDLGYETYFNHCGHRSKWHDRGLWNRQDAQDSFTALKFNNLFRRRDLNNTQHESTKDNDGHWTGTVKVTFYEYIELDGYYQQGDFQSPWKSDTEGILKGLDVTKNKKACNSVGGTAKSDLGSVAGKQRNRRKGAILATLTLHYCSTLGLIYANVLQPPPPPAALSAEVGGKRSSTKRRRTFKGKKAAAKVSTATEVEVIETA